MNVASREREQHGDWDRLDYQWAIALQTHAPPNPMARHWLIFVRSWYSSRHSLFKAHSELLTMFWRQSCTSSIGQCLGGRNENRILRLVHGVSISLYKSFDTLHLWRYTGGESLLGLFPREFHGSLNFEWLLQSHAWFPDINNGSCSLTIQITLAIICSIISPPLGLFKLFWNIGRISCVVIYLVCEGKLDKPGLHVERTQHSSNWSK